eukprot:COSAG02_NODE_54286_length_297_cov_0.510101_1_plen_87_part_01
MQRTAVRPVFLLLRGKCFALLTHSQRLLARHGARVSIEAGDVLVRLSGLVGMVWFDVRVSRLVHGRIASTTRAPHGCQHPLQRDCVP